MYSAGQLSQQGQERLANYRNNTDRYLVSSDNFHHIHHFRHHKERRKFCYQQDRALFYCYKSKRQRNQMMPSQQGRPDCRKYQNILRYYFHKEDILGRYKTLSLKNHHHSQRLQQLHFDKICLDF